MCHFSRHHFLCCSTFTIPYLVCCFTVTITTHFTRALPPPNFTTHTHHHFSYTGLCSSHLSSSFSSLVHLPSSVSSNSLSCLYLWHLSFLGTPRLPLLLYVAYFTEHCARAFRVRTGCLRIPPFSLPRRTRTCSFYVSAHAPLQRAAPAPRTHAPFERAHMRCVSAVAAHAFRAAFALTRLPRAAPAPPPAAHLLHTHCHFHFPLPLTIVLCLRILRISPCTFYCRLYLAWNDFTPARRTDCSFTAVHVCPIQATCLPPRTHLALPPPCYARAIPPRLPRRQDMPPRIPLPAVFACLPGLRFHTFAIACRFGLSNALYLLPHMPFFTVPPLPVPPPPYCLPFPEPAWRSRFLLLTVLLLPPYTATAHSARSYTTFCVRSGLGCVSRFTGTHRATAAACPVLYARTAFETLSRRLPAHRFVVHGDSAPVHTYHLVTGLLLRCTGPRSRFAYRTVFCARLTAAGSFTVPTLPVLPVLPVPVYWDRSRLLYVPHTCRSFSMDGFLHVDATTVPPCAAMPAPPFRVWFCRISTPPTAHFR